MVSVHYYKLFKKIIRFILQLCVNEKLPNKRVRVKPKVEVDIKELTDELETFFEFKVTLLGGHSHLFEVRHLLKTFAKDRDLFYNLQNKVGCSCLRVQLLMDGERVQYAVWLPAPDGSWSMQGEDVAVTRPYDQSVVVTLKVPLQAGSLMDAEKDIVQFLSRVLLLHPTFTLSCTSQGKLLFRSRDNADLKPPTTLLGKLKMYFRLYGGHSEEGKYGRTTRRTGKSSSDVTILYACTKGNSKAAVLNHLHVCVRSEDGLPVDLEVSEWCSLVQLSGVQLLPGSAVCSAGSWIPDICYPLVGDVAPFCYMAVIILETVDLQQQQHILSTRLSSAVSTMLTVAQDSERNGQLCATTAAAIGSILRHSLHPEFRNKCFSLLETSCTVEAEKKFCHKLSNLFLSVELVNESPNPSPGASDLTDEEQLLDWESTHDPVVMQDEAPLLSQAITLSDDEQFLDWNSPNKDKKSFEQPTAASPAPSHSEQDFNWGTPQDDTAMNVVDEDEQFLDWETSPDIDGVVAVK